MIHFERRQHSVGQGGFYSGTISIGEDTFRYVYDCGSTNRSALRKAIDYYSSIAPQVDVLFVSHFHNDHVSGLDYLLGILPIQAVVIPYLSPFERLVLSAKAADEGKLTGDLLELLFDPVDWFGSRGISNVIVTGPDRSNPTGFGPLQNRQGLPPTPLSPSVVRRIGIRFEKLSRIAPPEAGEADGQQPFPSVYFLPHQNPLPVTQPGGVVCEWEFLCYVHPEPMRLQEFTDRVTPIIGTDIGEFQLRPVGVRVEAVLSMVRDFRKRRELTAIYRSIFRDLNGTSLSLYSGPAVDQERMAAFERVRSVSHVFPPIDVELQKRVGWIGTGDADLRSDERRAPFLEHFDSRLRQVAVCTVPHHGSKNNFHRDLLDFEIPVFSVAAKAVNKHHPHKSVVEALGGHRVAQVSESDETYLDESGYVWIARQ